MVKVTLDMSTFKALASDTRLDILKALDGKKMALKDICQATRLNKATLHEHLSKLNEAGLVKKKEREGHKWVYYKLTWKGECLLHPENTKIVVLFSTTFFTLCLGIVNFIQYAKGYVAGRIDSFIGSDHVALYSIGETTEGALSDSLIKTGSSLDKLNYIPPQSPLMTVSSDQSVSQLSQTFIENTQLRGILANSINPENVQIASEKFIDSSDSFNSTFAHTSVPGSTGATYNGPQNFVLTTENIVVQDPAFQYIALACIVIFSILICFSILKYLKSKKLAL